MMKLNLLILATALGASHAAGHAAKVTNGKNDGHGSLRKALEGGATRIHVEESVKNIEISSTLKYYGTDPLVIKGFGQTVKADGDFTLLEIAEGADLSISKLSFQGVGGFNYEDNIDNPGVGKGVFIDVPTDRIGVVKLELKDVSVSDVANHGVHVSDCDLADECGGGGGGGGDGSPASVHVILKRFTVSNAGFGKFDGDGVRVDERGHGDIDFLAVDSTFVDCGADGAELDEGDDGDVFATVKNSVFKRNGAYCEPLLGVQNPSEPLDCDNSVSNPCCDDGEVDLDDGFDIDEAGDGSVYVTVQNTVVPDNLDQGLDFDEEGDGGIIANFISVTAKGNGDAGIKCSEEDGGDADVTLQSCVVKDNGADGVELESEDDGRIDVVVINTNANGNEDADLKVEQDNDDSGKGTLKITQNSNIGSVDIDDTIVEI